jgi:PAS domain S-box-containing protein
VARVVVAEDESVAAWYLREALENLGHTVLASVASGTDAIQVTGDTQPDLVLMDIRLEGLIDGIMAAQQIRDRFDVPVVYITAHADDATLQRAMNSEPFGYILKPFQERELQTAVTIALNRYQLEKRLRETEQRLTTTLMSIGEGTIATDTDGYITFMNPVAEEITGWQQLEAIGERSNRILDLIHAETGEALEPALRAIQEGSLRLSEHCVLRTKDGQEKPIDDTAAPIHNNDGVVTGSITVFRDVSDRVNAEATLRQQAEQERLIRAMAQRIRQSLDLDTILHTTAIEIRQLLQVDRVLICQVNEAGVSKLVTEVAAPEISPITVGSEQVFSAALYQIYAQGQVHATTEIEQDERLTDLLNILRQLNVRSRLVVPILQPEALWGVLILHQCRSQREWQVAEIELLQQLSFQVAIAIQQAQLYQQVQRLNADLAGQVQDRTTQLETAFEFEATLKRITDSVRDSLDEAQILQTAVQELASATGAECCNAAIYNLNPDAFTVRCEYTSCSTPTQGCIANFAAVSDLYQHLHHQILQGQFFQFCWLLPNPLRRRVAILVSPIFDNQGVIGNLCLIDHCDRLFDEQDMRLVAQVANQCAIGIRQARLYQSAQTQVQELERLNRLKDDFLSTISHELRTPLSNIIMAVQMLEIVADQEGRLDIVQGRAARYFDILREECRREIKLVDDLLGFPSLDAGIEPLNLNTLHLQDWIPHVVEIFQMRIESRGQRLELDLPSDLPPLLTDVAILSHILSELLNNACTYTPVGGQISIAAHATAETLFLSISNSGVEIPPEELPHVFDKFHRIPGNDPWQYTGTGLGLALVKKRTEYLGATIQAESSNNLTRFTLRFPL